MPELGTTAYLVVAAAIVLGALTQGALGFAFGHVSMALLPLVVPSKVAVPLVAVCLLPNVGLILWQCRRAVRFRDVWLLLPSLVVAVPVGVYVLSALPDVVIRRTIGALITVTAVQMLLGRTGRHARLHPAWAVAAGAGTGALGGAFNVGGAPMLFYFLAHDWHKDRIKGNFAFVGIISISLRVLLFRFVPMGDEPILGDSVLIGSLPLLPVVVVGTLLGSLAYQKMNQVVFRRAVLGALIVLGIVLIFG